MRFRAWIVICLIFICIGKAEGQEVDEENGIQRLDEIVITGTRTEKKLLETPVRTEVVTRKEIEKTHARDLKEALEDVPGLFLHETHGKQGQEVWMQGFDSDRILILLNGERLTATTGSTVDLTQITAANIERIEIIKGATSALYGSEAMGGVVNVITQSPTKPFSLTLQSDTGSYGDKNRESAALNGQLGAAHYMADLNLKRALWSFQVTTDFRRSEGMDLDKSTVRIDGDETSRWNLDTKLAFHLPGNNEIYLSPCYYQENKERPYSTIIPGVPGGPVIWKYLEDAERWHISVGGKTSLGMDSRLLATLTYEFLNDVSAEDVVASTQVEQKRTANIGLARGEVQWDLPVGERHLLTTGANIGRETLEQEKAEEGPSLIDIDQEIQPGANRENYEIYLQDDILLWPWLELLPGIRYQYDTDFGSFVAPKVNLMIKPISNLNFRLSYGKGYRVPNLKERFYRFDHTSLGYMVIGNPDLRPENSNSFQAGIEVWQGRSFHTEVNFFYNRIKDLIITEDNPAKSQPGLLIFDYQNVSRAVTQGTEFSTSFSFWRYFSLNAGYTYLWARNPDLDKWLVQRPRHQVKGGIDIKQGDWGTTLSLRSVYQSKEFVDEENTKVSPSWTTLDVKLNQELRWNTMLFVGVDNILDMHRDPNSTEGNDIRPPTGRFVYIGMRISI